MIRAAVLLLTISLLAACDDAGAPSTPNPHGARYVGGRIGEVYVWHDDARSVTCWTKNEGIACLPDSALARDGGAP